MTDRWQMYTDAAPRVASGWTFETVTAPSRLGGANVMTFGPDGRLYVTQVFASQVTAIDITDHNTVAGIGAIRRELEWLTRLNEQGRLNPQEQQRLDEWRALSNQVVVLPGFEFTATFGFHILGIFPPETSIRHLEHVLLAFVQRMRTTAVSDIHVHAHPARDRAVGGTHRNGAHRGPAPFAADVTQARVALSQSADDRDVGKVRQNFVAKGFAPRLHPNRTRT